MIIAGLAVLIVAQVVLAHVNLAVEQVALAVQDHVNLAVKELVLVVRDRVLFHVLGIVQVIVVLGVLFHVPEIVQVIALDHVLLLVQETQVVMEVLGVPAHNLDVVEHVLVNVPEGVLPHVLVHAQWDVEAVQVLVRELVVAVAAGVVPTIALVHVEVVAEGVLDAIK